MDTTTLVIIMLVVVVAGTAAIFLMQKRRSEDLQSRFGPEYEQTLEETGDRRKAEAELAERAKRVESLSIVPLSSGDRDRFTSEWQNVQAEFVDDPQRSISHADKLIQEVMKTRGYPVESFDQVAADVSVDHPLVVQNYRAGHEIVVRHGKGEADTEDLRQAMIHYRELFNELVTEAAPEDEPEPARTPETETR